jgi:hypothetical protein
LVGQESGKAEAQKMVGEQFQRVWEELAKGKLRAEGSTAGRLLARTLSVLSDIDDGEYFIEVLGTILIDPTSLGLFWTAWNPLVAGMKDSTLTNNLPLVSVLLKVFNDQFDDGTRPKQAILSLTAEVIQSVLVQCEIALESDKSLKECFLRLVNLLDVFGGKLFNEAEIARVKFLLRHA